MADVGEEKAGRGRLVVVVGAAVIAELEELVDPAALFVPVEHPAMSTEMNARVVATRTLRLSLGREMSASHRERASLHLSKFSRTFGDDRIRPGQRLGDALGRPFPGCCQCRQNSFPSGSRNDAERRLPSAL